MINSKHNNIQTGVLLALSIMLLLYLFVPKEEETIIKDIRKDVYDLVGRKDDTLAQVRIELDQLQDTIVLLQQYMVQQESYYKKELKKEKKKNKDEYEKSLIRIDTASVDANLRLFGTNFSDSVQASTE